MRKRRFSDGVAAIESTPKALRSMLQNPKMVLPSSSRDGWSEFSPLQLALLAIDRRLVDFGFSVEQASLTACMCVTSAFAFAQAERDLGQPLSAGKFLELLKREYIVAYVRPGDTEIFTESRQSDSWPPLSEELQKLAVLIVPVSAVVARCFSRAPVMPEDDMTGSDDDLLRTMLQFRIEFCPLGSETPSLILPGKLPDAAANAPLKTRKAKAKASPKARKVR